MPTRSEILERVGHVTRLLHDSLAELGLDKALLKFSSQIPEARDRLSYVSQLTQQSADIVLTATERAAPLHDMQLEQASKLELRLNEILNTQEFSASSRETFDQVFAFIKSVQDTSLETKQLILSIMMAQDFQDLTGQMIQTMSNLTQNLEQQLAQILLDFTTHHVDTPATKTDQCSLLNGPQIVKSGNTEAITTQAQVDALLESLGY